MITIYLLYLDYFRLLPAAVDYVLAAALLFKSYQLINSYCSNNSCHHRISIFAYDRCRDTSLYKAFTSMVTEGPLWEETHKKIRWDNEHTRHSHPFTTTWPVPPQPPHTDTSATTLNHPRHNYYFYNHGTKTPTNAASNRTIAAINSNPDLQHVKNTRRDIETLPHKLQPQPQSRK